MKRILVIIFTTLCAIIALAQQPMAVQCQVNDSEGEGIPFATIYLYNSNDTAKVVGRFALWEWPTRFAHLM